jgi:hypothetical protein
MHMARKVKQTYDFVLTGDPFQFWGKRKILKCVTNLLSIFMHDIDINS